MYNKVILLGRITQDLELKTTQSNVSVLSFSVACDRRFQQKGEERKSDFFNCVAWRNEAEFISKYWHKGDPILVEGELQNRQYEDKNGVKRYMTEVIIDRATFTGNKGNSSGGTQSAQTVAQTAAASDTAVSQGVVNVSAEVTDTDEDYPF